MHQKFDAHQTLHVNKAQESCDLALMFYLKLGKMTNKISIIWQLQAARTKGNQ